MYGSPPSRAAARGPAAVPPGRRWQRGLQRQPRLMLSYIIVYHITIAYYYSIVWYSIL